MPVTDYTDPTTIDVTEVMANINNAYRMRGHNWTQRPFWPNVTVKALADEVERLRAALAARPQAKRPLLSAALDEAEAEIERLRHALINVAENLHGAGLISDVAKADILAVTGSATPTQEPDLEALAAPIVEFIKNPDPGKYREAGSATPTGDNDD